MKLERVKLTASEVDNDTSEVLAMKIVYEPMKNGAFIAGGFARCIAHMVLLNKGNGARDYLSPTMEQFSSPRPGDVDIFFPPDIDMSEYLAMGELSVGGFARNVFTSFDSDSKGGYRNNWCVQLVDHKEFRYPDVTTCLASFDLVNSRYAIMAEAGSIYLYWDPEAIRLDKDKLIGICKSDTPFLSSRVMKYLNIRGCDNGLAPGSDEMLTEWFIRASSGAWPEYFSARHKSSVDKHVRVLARFDLMRVTDLTLFLGRWKQAIRKEKYGSEYVVDWACNKISEMTGVEGISS